jgi:hypothetical protein
MATGRIGTTPALGFRWSKAPAGGTTSLSGTDDNSVGLTYTPGNERVYRNGVLLSRGNDYTATSGNSITLEDATITGDIIEVFSQELTQLADTIAKSQLTAKGQILTATAASTPAVLSVGTNNQVLTADSAETTGLKWVTPVAPPSDPPYLSNPTAGRYLSVRLADQGAGTNAASTVARTCYTPVYLPTCTLDRIAVQTQSFSGNYTVRLGIYNDNNGKPSTVLLNAGTVSATAGNTTYEITINQAITAGWYWLAANNQTEVSAGTREFLSTGTGASIPQFFADSAGPAQATPPGWVETGITGAFATASPTIASVFPTFDNLIITYVRVA